MTKKDKQFTIAKKKMSRIRMSEEQVREFEKYRELLGYSENEFAEAILLSGMSSGSDEVEDSFYLFEDRQNKMLEIDKTLSQITVDLRLTSYSQSEDPILMILPELSERLKIPMQQIIKNLYMSFLDSNDILIKDSDNKVTDYEFRLLATKSSFLPYNWSGNIFLEIDLLKSDEERYVFMSSGNFKRSNKLTILLSGEEGEAMAKTLPLICKKLHRSKSSLFKILTMHWFRVAGLVNKKFILVKDWKEELHVIANQFNEVIQK